MVGKMGPSAIALNTTEVKFSPDLVYPYDFTVMVANMNHGEKGYGSFILQVYAKDKNIKLQRLN